LKTQLILFALIAIPLTSIAYAETPSHIEIWDHPFEATVMEGGSITIHNESDTNYNFVSWGWFDEVYLQPNDSITIELPNADCGNYCFIPGVYYFTDLDDEIVSLLTIEAKPVPIVETPPPQPTTPIVPTNSTSANIVPIIHTGANHTLEKYTEITLGETFRVTNLNPYETIHFENLGGIDISIGVGATWITEDLNVGTHVWKDQFGDSGTVVVNVPRSEPQQTLPTSSTSVELDSGADTEVLDLRLRILQVLESIFKIVLN